MVADLFDDAAWRCIPSAETLNLEAIVALGVEVGPRNLFHVKYPTIPGHCRVHQHRACWRGSLARSALRQAV
jgi:hypothetical protein